jgi:hypothetical protein
MKMPNSNNLPQWRAIRPTASQHNMLVEVGEVVFGPRPLRASGQANHDFAPENDAARLLANPPGPSGYTATLISKAPEPGIPPAPWPGMIQTGRNSSGDPIYGYAPPEPKPEPEEALFRVRAQRGGVHIAGTWRENGEVFSVPTSYCLEDHERNVCVPTNDLAHEVFSCRRHPEISPAESARKPVNTRTAYDPFRRSRPDSDSPA